MTAGAGNERRDRFAKLCGALAGELAIGCGLRFERRFQLRIALDRGHPLELKRMLQVLGNHFHGFTDGPVQACAFCLQPIPLDTVHALSNFESDEKLRAGRRHLGAAVVPAPPR